jgi:C4-dicarboxylate transporter, DctQ subunit
MTPVRGVGHLLGRALDRAEEAFAFAAGALVFVGVGTVVFEVSVRYVAGRSFPLVLELNAIFMLYIPFLAGAWVLRRGGQITIDIADGILHGWVRHAADAVVTLIGFVTSAVIAYYGLVLTLEAHRRGLATLAVVRIPEWSVMIAVPAGATLFALEFFRQFCQALQGRRVAGVRGVTKPGEGRIPSQEV